MHERTMGRPPRGALGAIAAAIAALGLVALALAMGPQQALATSCDMPTPDIYDLKAKHVSCGTAAKVAKKSFNRKCLTDGCKVLGFSCKPHVASDPPPGLAGGFEVCKKGRQKVKYGFGG